MALLEQTGAAMLRRDLHRFAQAFALPHRVSTFERTVVIEDMAGLHRTFHKVCDELDRLGVTDLSRHCIAAQFRDPDTIAHTHISQSIAGDRRVNDPYPCFSILTRENGLWKVRSSDYALAEGSHARALTVLADDIAPALARNAAPRPEVKA